jgi:hypothetical protein
VLRDVAGRGKGVIFISSELPELMTVSDRILVFRQGQVVLEADPRTVGERAISARPPPQGRSMSPTGSEPVEGGRSPVLARLGNDFWARYGVPLALVALIVFFTLWSPTFMTDSNVMNILRQSSVLAIAAIGATIVLISGGIDISQGAIMALAGIIVVVGIQTMGVPEVPSLHRPVATVGPVNGLLAERVRIPPSSPRSAPRWRARHRLRLPTGGRSASAVARRRPRSSVARQASRPAPVPVVRWRPLRDRRRSCSGAHGACTPMPSARRSAPRASPGSGHPPPSRSYCRMLSGLAGVILAGRLAGLPASAPASTRHPHRRRPRRHQHLRRQGNIFRR